MEEGLGQAAYGFEAEILPDANGALVGTYYEVELHSAKAALAGALQGMGAHGPGEAAAGSLRGGHVTAVGHVIAAALLIGAEEVGGDYMAMVIGDKDFVAGGEPIDEGLVAGEIAGKGIGFAGADGGFEDAPNGIAIVFGGWSNDYVHRLLVWLN